MNKALHINCYTVVLVIGFAQDVIAGDKQESKNQLEIRHTMTIETTPPAEQRCEAQIGLTYYQKNTIAVVESELTNSDCAASGGTYTVLVRFRDKNNELHSLEFPETWHRDDDRDYKSVKEYSIGQNVDLVNVRSRSLQCVCDKTDTAQEEAPE